MKNKEKSNRAAADYFELLVCQSICSMYNITFSYSTNLAELSNQVLKQDKINKTEKLKLQNDNLLKINPVLKKNFR